MKIDLEYFEKLTEEELLEVAYLEARNTQTDKKTLALIVALIGRIVKNSHGYSTLSAILPGLNAITECIERTIERDLDA